MVIPKLGLGYSFAAADSKNKNDNMPRKLQGKNLTIDCIRFIFLLIQSNLIEQLLEIFFLTLS
jgi:hypothetical protein